jgi:hypothetical protein
MRQVANCEGVSQTRLAEISEVDPVRLVCILDRLGRDTSTEALKGVTSDELHPLMDLLERVRTNLLALEAQARAGVAPRPTP